MRARLRPAADAEPRAWSPGQIAYTLLLREDGTVLIDATVWCLDAIATGCSPAGAARSARHDVSGAFTILALQGPASGWILARVLGPDAVGNLRYFRFLEKDDLIVARLGFSGELGYELLVPAAEAAALRQKLLDAGRNEGLRTCGWAAADSLRIEAGYVLFDREIDGRANPSELGLERFAPKMKFDAARRLVGLDILDEPGRSDLPPAKVTSECFSPTLGKSLALGFVSPATIDTGSAVRLGDGRIARVAALPFYDPKRRRPRDNPL